MIDAEHAFTRTRRRAVLKRALRSGSELPVLCATAGSRGPAGIREIPLDAITGTLEPSRAAQFDSAFRPVRRALRTRWERISSESPSTTRAGPVSGAPGSRVPNCPERCATKAIAATIRIQSRSERVRTASG